jgi:hypothetical protein
MNAAQSVFDDEAQFRVRFTRSRGFAALFERPENSYQWSGYGTLRVEPRGIQFRATRRVIGLPRVEARFVAGREINNVYREGDGVRVEFREDTRQNVLNFWAEDSAAAASIVEQLPTVHTVEVDEAPRGSGRSRKRTLRVDMLVLAVGALVVIAAGAWGALQLINRAPASNLQNVSGDASSSLPVPQVEMSTPDAVETTTSIEVLARPMPAADLELLRQDFARFTARSEPLRAQFDTAFKALLDGSLSQRDFADGLQRWLIPQWISVEKALRETPYPEGAPREEFRHALIDIATDWQTGLEAYATGLREQQSKPVRRAFARIGFAEESEREARERLAR